MARRVVKGRRRSVRPRMTPRFQLAETATINYKNISLLQKFLTDRGKLISRRISGVTAKQQRQLSLAVKRARFLALLTTGGVKK